MTAQIVGKVEVAPEERRKAARTPEERRRKNDERRVMSGKFNSIKGADKLRR